MRHQAAWFLCGVTFVSMVAGGLVDPDFGGQGRRRRRAAEPSGVGGVGLLEDQGAVGLALANAPEEAWRPGPRRSLTHREAEVAALAARGLTNREIAAQLFLSVRTVEVHVDHILTKLGFHTRSQLAAWAYEEGLLPGNT